MQKHEAIQKAHYDKIISSYDAHYSDVTSLAYRERFIYPLLFQNIPLEKSKVLDAMCGAGDVSSYLLSKGADVSGIDISEGAIARYKQKLPKAEGYIGSIANTEFPADTFDIITIIGGLHHLHPATEDTLNEITRILKPGGYLCFVEPHKGSFPDFVRKIWYNNDPLFEENEESIDLQYFKSKFETKYSFKYEYYRGNIAYLLVFNSLILRVPLWLKKFYAPLLFIIEMLLTPFTSMAVSSCMCINQWQKKIGPPFP